MKRVWMFVLSGSLAAGSLCAQEAGKGDPIPSPAIITSPKDSHDEGFTIQVFSFKERERADKAFGALKSKGYDAFQEVSDLRDKGVFYRVRVRGLKDEAAAEKALADIKKNYQTGFIVNQPK